MTGKAWGAMTREEKVIAFEDGYWRSRRESQRDVAEREKSNPLAVLFRRKAPYQEKRDFGPTWARGRK